MTTERKFYLAGVQFRPNAVAVLNELNEGDILDLEPEPTNKYDPNAIKILSGVEHVGYVPKTLSAEIATMIELNECECEITALNKGGKPWELCEVIVRPVIVETEAKEVDYPELDEDEEDICPDCELPREECTCFDEDEDEDEED